MRAVRTRLLIAIAAVASGGAVALAVAQGAGASGASPLQGTTTGSTTTGSTTNTVPTGTDDYYTTPTNPGGGGNGGGGNGGGKPDEVKLKGKVTKKGIGQAKLGKSKRQVERKLRNPRRSKSDHLLYDVKGGGELVIGFKGRDSAFVGTDSDRVKLDKIRVGDSESKARRALGKKADRKGRLLLLEKGKATFVVGTGSGDVESVGVADSDLADGKIKKFVKRLG